jgi:transposase
MERERTWAPASLRASAYRSAGYFRNVTVVGAIRQSGPVAMRTLEGSMTSVRFYQFLKNILFPAMKRNDVLVMDNLRAHHHVGIALLAEQHHVRVLYLPPYSPELNPIELVWSTMKSRLRKRQDWNRRTFPRKLGACWRTFRGTNFKRSFASCLRKAQNN